MKLLLDSEITKIIGGQTCVCLTRSFYIYISAKCDFSSAAGINDFVKRTTASAQEKITFTGREASESACKIKCCPSEVTYHGISYGTQTLIMYRYSNSPANIFNLPKHCD